MINNSMLTWLKDQSGLALPMALILMVVASFIVVPGLWATGSMIKVNQALENDTMAYYAAKSGVEDAMWVFKNGNVPGWTGTPPSYTPYSALTNNPVNGMTVQVTMLSKVSSGPFSDTYTIKSEAIDSSGKTLRTIYGEIVNNTGSSPFQYGIVALDGGITLQQSSSVISEPPGKGNIYSNGPIIFENTANIDGIATCNTTITGCAAAGGCFPNATTKVFDTVDNATYVTGASYYGIPNARIIPSGGTLLNPASLGGRTVVGNLEVKNSTLQLTGMVWVTGDIVFQSSKLIGTGNLATNYLVADGNIIFKVNSLMLNYPTIISWKKNITVLNQTNGSEIGTLYAPNGNIEIDQGGTIRGSIVGKTVTMRNTSYVIYPENAKPDPIGMAGGRGTTLTKYIGQ